jgi:hypothetical protein
MPVFGMWRRLGRSAKGNEAIENALSFSELGTFDPLAGLSDQ